MGLVRPGPSGLLSLATQNSLLSGGQMNSLASSLSSWQWPRVTCGLGVMSLGGNTSGPETASHRRSTPWPRRAETAGLAQPPRGAPGRQSPSKLKAKAMKTINQLQY